jgi:hypothetical protein
MEAQQLKNRNSLALDLGPLKDVLHTWMLSNLQISPQKGIIEEALSRTFSISIGKIQTMLEICATYGIKGASGWETLPSAPIIKELDYILFSGLDIFDQQSLRLWHKDRTSGDWTVKKSVYDAIDEDWRVAWFATWPLPDDIQWRLEQRIYPYSYSSTIIQSREAQFEADFVPEELD